MIDCLFWRVLKWIRLGQASLHSNNETRKLGMTWIYLTDWCGSRDWLVASRLQKLRNKHYIMEKNLALTKKDKAIENGHLCLSYPGALNDKKPTRNILREGFAANWGLSHKEVDWW